MAADPTVSIFQGAKPAPERAESPPKPALSAVPGPPKPPPGLSPGMRAWFRECNERWLLESHHQHILGTACRALDRADEARREIKKRGLLVTSPTGELKPNPACAVEKNSMATALRAIRELDLDITPPPAPSRVRGRR